MAKSIVPNPILLVIDPAMRSPAIEALNCVLQIVADFRSQPGFFLHQVEYFCPYLNQMPLSEFVADKNIGACICLGSHANITDQHHFVQTLEQDLKRHVFSKQIPFLGICFSHQLLAYMNGFQVGYLKNRNDIKYKKHNHVREFDIIHPKLSLLAVDMHKKDYFSDSLMDLNFKKSIEITKGWEPEKWEKIQKKPSHFLSYQENFVKIFLDQHTLKKIKAHARHEQEVLTPPARSSFLIGAATSSVCDFEALVDLKNPFYSFQTHLETKCHQDEGAVILKNFIYLSNEVLT